MMSQIFHGQMKCMEYIITKGQTQKAKIGVIKFIGNPYMEI